MELSKKIKEMETKIDAQKSVMKKFKETEQKVSENIFAYA